MTFSQIRFIVKYHAQEKNNNCLFHYYAMDHMVVTMNLAQRIITTRRHMQLKYPGPWSQNKVKPIA